MYVIDLPVHIRFSSVFGLFSALHTFISRAF